MRDNINDTSVALTLDDLRQFPKTEYNAVHTCMQGWSATSRWGGVRLRDLLAHIGPRPEGANYVMVTSHGLAQEMIDHRPREPFYAVLDPKATGRPLKSLLFGVTAGGYIALGFVFFVTSQVGAAELPWGVARVLGGWYSLPDWRWSSSPARSCSPPQR